MSRRRFSRWLPWRAAYAELFDLAPADWTPPAKVRVSGSFERSSWSARFRRPDGLVVTARVRVLHDQAHDVFTVQDASLSMAMSVRGRAA